MSSPLGNILTDPFHKAKWSEIDQLSCGIVPFDFTVRHSICVYLTIDINVEIKK